MLTEWHAQNAVKDAGSLTTCGWMNLPIFIKPWSNHAWWLPVTEIHISTGKESTGFGLRAADLEMSVLNWQNTPAGQGEADFVFTSMMLDSWLKHVDATTGQLTSIASFTSLSYHWLLALTKSLILEQNVLVLATEQPQPTPWSGKWHAICSCVKPLSNILIIKEE